MGGRLLFFFVACVLACVTGVSQPARADAVAVSFPDIGLGDRVELNGLSASQTYVLPVNPDAAPVALRGHADGSLDINAARLEVLVDGARAAVVDLGAGAGPGVDFAVPLSGVAASGEGVVVEFRSSVTPTDAYCRGQYAVPRVTLRDLRADYDQTAAPPTDIASFLPPLVREIGLWLPARPSDSVLTAALRVTTGLTRRYGSLPVRFVTHTLADATAVPVVAYEPLRRDIAFTTRDGKLSLVRPDGQGIAAAPVLVLGGEHIERQADLVVSQVGKVVTASDANIAGRATAALLPAREQRLTDLGLTTISATGTGKVRITTGVAQAAFGGMTKSMTLRVSGRHTPVGRRDTASVSVFVNDALVGSTRSAANGRFSVQATIVEPTLDRTNRIDIVAENRSNGGPCSTTALPIEVQVSTGSTVEAAMGPSLPVGFRRIPQALLPRAGVALADREESTVAALVGVVNAVQRVSPVALDLAVLTMKQAAASTRPLIAVVRDQLPGVALKFAPTAEDAALVDLRNRRVDVPGDGGSIQVLEHHNRTVLVVTGRADAGRNVVEVVAARRGGLASLSGDLVVSRGADRLTEAQFDDAAPVATTQPQPARPWKWLAASVGLIAVSLAAATVLASRRRRRPSAASPR